MADEVEEQVADALGEADSPGGDAAAGSRLRPIIIAAAVVVLFGAGAGYGTARLFGGSGGPRPPRREGPAAEVVQAPRGKQGQFAYYDMQAITVNLYEPRLARYLRTTLTLAFRPENYEAGTEMIQKKLPELRSWLTVYLSGCTLEDVRGPKNLNRIRREIHDSFNRQLWPDNKPLIEKVFLKEFVVQ